MDQKRYFFSKVSKRDSFLKHHPKKPSNQGLILPSMSKIYSLCPNFSQSPPFSLQKPNSVSPIQRKQSTNPRSQSHKQMTQSKFPRIKKPKKLEFKTKSNIRYLKQDFEDIEIINNIKTPEESYKSTKHAVVSEWTIPDIDDIFSYFKTNLKETSKLDSFENPKLLRQMKSQLAVRDTTEE